MDENDLDYDEVSVDGIITYDIANHVLAVTL